MRAAPATLVTLLCVALLAPQWAGAQERDPSPSARELRETYPLRSESDPRPDAGDARPPAATRTDAAPAGVPSVETSDGSASPTLAAVLVAIAFVAGVALGLRPLGRRLRRGSPERTGAEPASAGQAPAPREEVSETPSPLRAWTAEIEWRPAGGDSRFRVVARAADGAGTAVLMESPPVQWPPSGPEGVRALTAAADDLEARLVAEGWRPTPAGDAWYARRFAWEPVVEPEAAPVRQGRFARRAARSVPTHGGRAT